MPSDSRQLLVTLILGIWFCAAIASAFTKDSQCIGAALVVTVIIGIVWCVRH